MNQDRKFPIGPFVIQESYTAAELDQIISIIEKIPSQYRLLVENLPEEELGKTYREGGWNVRQLVHHVADIQFLHYFRMKKVLTEPDYKEATLIDMPVWAMTPDSEAAPVEHALNMLEGVHARYIFLARNLSENQLALSYLHPARKIWFDQKQALAISAWHAQHHLAHIALALS